MSKPRTVVGRGCRKSGWMYWLTPVVSMVRPALVVVIVLMAVGVIPSAAHRGRCKVCIIQVSELRSISVVKHLKNEQWSDMISNR